MGQMPRHDTEGRIWVIGRHKEREPVDVIPMCMGQEDMGMGDIAPDQILAKVADPGPGIKDQDLVTDTHFNATGIATINNMVR